MRPCAVLLVPLLGGCASKVIAEYTDLRMQTLADPGPAPDGWAADGVIVLAPNVVEQIVRAALDAHGVIGGEIAFTVPLVGQATVRPELSVTDLVVGPGAACDDCVAVRTSLDGNVGWKVGRHSGRAPITATADLDTEFVTTRQDDGGFLITARPREVRDLDVRVAGSVTILGPLLSSEVSRWLQADLDEWVEPIVLGTIGGEAVPLRAARVRGAGKGIAIDLLTRSSTPQPLQGGPPTGVLGWELRVSTDSLLDVARRESFVRGPVAHDVVVDPRSLAFEDGDLVLGMRLWRTKGRGWWRDYIVHVALDLSETDVSLKATSVEEAGHSPGAAWVDPLAALVEGRILEGIERAIRANAPAGWSGQAGDVKIAAVVREVGGGEGFVRVSGDLRATATGDTPAIDRKPVAPR